MTTIKNSTGSKVVNIIYNDFNGYRASYVQVYNLHQQVLEAKSFSTQKDAEKWAGKKLS